MTLIAHYGRRHTRIAGLNAGFVAWIVGIAASVPFFNQYPLFVGAFAAGHPGFVDISFLVSAVVAAIVFLALTAADVSVARHEAARAAMRV